jgi:DNA-binding LytR/AlgR family response regulator
MGKISIYYLDDDAKNVQYFQTITQQHERLELLGATQDYKQALTDILRKKPDIVVLDIEMPDLNGFEMADMIAKEPAFVVFLTCHTEFAVDAYRFDPLHYLIKPIGLCDLDGIVQRYEKRRHRLPEAASQRKDQILVNTLKSFEFINCDDVAFIRSEEGYSHFILTDSNGQPIISSKNLRHYETELQAHPDFFRIHKSYIINRKQLRKIVKHSANNFEFLFKCNHGFTVASFNKEVWLESFVA